MPASSVTVSATFKETQATIDANAAAAVIAKINAIGTVAYTSDSKKKIDDARSAYDALTSDQKTLVTNFGTLTTAESSYESLAPVSVTAITLNKTETSIKVGATETLSVTAVAPDNATDKTYTWKTSDESKATVDQDGKVTAVAAGTVTIYAEANDGSGVKGNCTVTVSPSTVLVTAITLNKTATEIKVGSTETLSVTAVTPDDTTDKTVTWSSDNEAVATVDADGKVTAVALGTANITATANDGSGVKGNCTVTVSPATITVTWNNNDITGTSGNSFTKDGVTITAGNNIDFRDKNFMNGGTFTTTLGNFTKIVVSGGFSFAGPKGAGWSNRTWTGNASSVTFTDDIMGAGQGNLKFVFTIGPAN